MKTVRVRIAVLINADGQWGAGGGNVGGPMDDDNAATHAGYHFEDVPENHDTLHWIEADVPVPEKAPAQTIEGKVVS